MSVASFIPKLWAPELLVPFKKSSIYTQPGIADTKYQPMLQNSGDTVEINSIGNATIKNHDRTKDLEYDDLTTTSVKLVMDQEKYYGFRVSDVDRVQAAGDFASAATNQHGSEMADKIDKAVAEALKEGAGNKLKNQAVFDGSDFYRPGFGQITAWDVVRKLATELNKVSAPTSQRWIVVGPNFGSALLADRRVTQAHAAGTDIVARNGLISSIPQLGLNVYQSNNAPVTAGREGIVAGVPGALAFATQLRELEAFRDPDRFGDIIRGLQVFGAKVVNPKGLVYVETDVAQGALGSAAPAEAA